MADKLTSASSITHFNTLMNQIQKNVKTDLKLGDLNTIRTKYKDANDQVNRHQLEVKVVYKMTVCTISYQVMHLKMKIHNY